MEQLNTVFSASGWVFPILVLIVVILVLNSVPRKNLPPGPISWPVVGYLPYIFSEKPTKFLSKFKAKYGNVFGFYVGSRYCVTLCDFAAVKEGFCKKSVQTRPPRYLRTSTEYKNYSEMDVPQWKAHRQLISSSLVHLGVGRIEFEEMVLDGVSRVIAKMEQHVGQKSCNIRKMIITPINNAVFRVMCSRWFDDDHPVMKNFEIFLSLVADSFTNNMAFIYFPWLDWILNKVHPHYRAISRSSRELADFVRSEVETRVKTHNENSSSDYIDLYLREMKSGKHDQEYFNKNHLVTNSLLMLMAGSDTVRNTLEWLLMAMAQFTEIQTKVATEIHTVIGSEKTPLLSDKISLPYTEATILESERWRTLVPLNCLRWTTEPTIIQGFTIPKDTVIINNLHDCHMDPKYWENPKEFSPDRFLSQDKTRVIVPECFMPFSIGKRNCPGEKMASTQLFLYFSRIIQKFRILAPEGGVSFKTTERINRMADNPFVRLELR